MSIYEENQTSSSEQENSWLRRNWNQAKGKQKFCTAYKFSPHSQSVMVKQLKRPPDTLMWRELDGSGDLQDIKAHLGLLHSLISVSVSLGHSVQAGSAPCCCGWAAAWAGVGTDKVWEETSLKAEPALVEAEEALHVRQPQAGSTRAAQAGRSKATDGVSVQ